MRFCCPNCGGKLNINDRSAVCINGHSFDKARGGYYNLLVGNTGGVHGDNKEMVLARRAFLGAGFYEPLAHHIADLVLRFTPKGGALLDAGAGEDAVFRFAQMAAATYQNTMLKGQSDDVNAEFFPDLYNRGILPGNSIIFFFRDRISADRMEDEDIAFEQKKDRIFANVKQQFEQLASREKAYHTWLFRM
jgi:hypothetical protein